MIKASGSINKKTGRFYPIAHWTKSDVMAYIRKERLYLPKDSRGLGFSFKSLAGEELAWVKETYPEDYKKIIQMYPFAEAAVKRLEYYGE